MFLLQVTIVLLCIAALTALCFGVIYYIANQITMSVIRPQPVSYGTALNEEITRNHLSPSAIDIKYEKLFFQNKRNQNLTARLYPANSQTDCYILFFHGYNYPWVGALKYLPLLTKWGFNVLVPDMQAQGESEGNYITFGALESDDGIEWLEQIRHYAKINGFERARIGIMGESMGAVAALMTAAKANSPSVSVENKPIFCIADCPFSDWDSIFLFIAKKRYHINLKLLLPLLHSIIKRKTGINFSEVSAIKAVSMLRIPTLIFHGMSDPLVPSFMSEQIVKENPKISLCLVEGAKHMNCFSTDPEKYQQQLIELFKQVSFETESSEKFAVYL